MVIPAFPSRRIPPSFLSPSERPRTRQENDPVQLDRVASTENLPLTPSFARRGKMVFAPLRKEGEPGLSLLMEEGNQSAPSPCEGEGWGGVFALLVAVRMRA